MGPGKDTHGTLWPDQREGRGWPEHSSAQQYSAETRQTAYVFALFHFFLFLNLFCFFSFLLVSSFRSSFLFLFSFQRFVRMFCISSQSHRFLFHSCTHDVPVALNLLVTPPFQRDTCDRSMCKGSVRHQRLFSCWFGARHWTVWKRSRSPRWNLCLQREILSAKHISLLTLAVYDFDVTAGGGTGGLWWTVVVHVYCEVDEQLVSGDTGQKRNPQSW